MEQPKPQIGHVTFMPKDESGERNGYLLLPFDGSIHSVTDYPVLADSLPPKAFTDGDHFKLMKTVYPVAPDGCINAVVAKYL